MFRRNFIKGSLFGVMFAGIFGKKSLASDADYLIDLTFVKKKKSIMVKKNNVPIYIIYRTDEEIKHINDIDKSLLIEPVNDSDRVKNKNFLVVTGICPHQGCVVSDNQFTNDVKEKFICPCHGSKFDASGRCLTGPAVSNLEIPKYEIINNKIKLI